LAVHLPQYDSQRHAPTIKLEIGFERSGEAKSKIGREKKKKQETPESVVVVLESGY
jgi:hypothetical protein